MELPNKIYINSLCRGDKDFELKLITVIKSEFPEEKKKYYKALNESNFKEIAEAVHKLKHKISILGLNKGYRLAARFENDILEEENVRLSHKFEEILDKMTEYLKNL